jgi:ABC-type branched-subunit amino acid transport system permease subunit
MRLGLYVVLVGLFATLPLLFPWVNFVFTLALAKGFAALGVALMLRAGLISIGHALFFAVGAYATAFFSRAWGISDVVVLLLASGLAATLIGAMVGAFMVRYRGIFFAMLNLAVSMVFFSLLAKLYRITGGTDGLRVPTPTVLGWSFGRTEFEWILLYGSLALVIGTGYLVHRYLASPMGQALSAVHTNEVRVEYLGLSVWGVLLSGYTISAALAGVGGAIAAIAVGHVVPEMSYWTVSGQLVLIAVLGGIGGVVGPFVGAIFLEVVRSFAVGYVGDAWNLIVGASLLAVIFFLPTGLYGLISRSRRKAVPA